MTRRKLHRLTVTIPADLVPRLDRYAADHRWSRSTAVTALIEEGLPAEQDQGQEQGQAREDIVG